MTPRELLIAAKARIDTPDKWAGNIEQVIGGKDCALVALTNIQAPYAVYCSVLETLVRVIGERSIAAWNDSHTHAEVMAAFDRAIKEATDAVG